MNIFEISEELDQKPLAQRLRSVIDLQLPGFARIVPKGEVGQLSFHEVSSEKWYQEFLDRIHQSIGYTFLPIYRMADGEFIFCVGWKPELPRQQSSLYEKARVATMGKIKTFLGGVGSKSRTVWGEDYSKMTRSELMTRYVRCLETVANHGLLAIHFTRSPGRFSEQYFEPMCDWFEKNQIPVIPENYIPFYFVYALLSGPDCGALMKEKRLLIVTSAGDQKKLKITHYLESLGARDIQYLAISPDRALLDKIDLCELKGPIDIALVAGGIGSVNILEQLRPLNTVCLDIGICLEIFADSSKRGRIFTVPDQPVV